MSVQLLFPGIDQETMDKLVVIAEHWDLDLHTLVQSTCVVTAYEADGTAYWMPVGELINYFGADRQYRPTRRRLILHYAAQLSRNPFIINDLLAFLPTSRISIPHTSWYTKKTVAHALGYALSEEEQWFSVTRTTFGKLDHWFVAERRNEYSPLYWDQLDRLYKLDVEDYAALAMARAFQLINITFSEVNVMLDCMTSRYTLDREAVKRHVQYFQKGYDRQERLRALLIDFIGNLNSADYLNTDTIRRRMIEHNIGHPYIHMTQESLGYQLRRTWQSQQQRGGTLSVHYHLERLNRGNAWIWRTTPHDHPDTDAS